MIKIDLSAVPSRINSHFSSFFKDESFIEVLKGGASSSKSFSVAQKIIYKCLVQKGHRFLVVRKVGKTLKHSVYDLIKYIINDWGMNDLFKFSRSDLTIICKINNNEILFTGLDDVEKQKSIFGITDIWVEEASEITEVDFDQLCLRLRGISPYPMQIIITFNPISTYHWIKKRFWDKKEKAFIHESTYLDNKFLDARTKSWLEDIKDPYFKSVYVKGDWGVFGNVVFTNWIVEDFNYTEEDLENFSVGMDFGFGHASTMILLGYRDQDIYILDELYGKGWTNADFIQAAEETFINLNYWSISADAAEPDRILEWQRKGYNVHAVKKGKNSLNYGIDYLCQHRIYIHPRCVNTIKEFQSFKRREDKDGNVIDKFVELNDDCIAAIRYGTEWMWSGTLGNIAEYSLAELGL